MNKLLVCRSCELEFLALKRCGKCGHGLYCGKECQLKDWVNHKSECKISVRVACEFGGFKEPSKKGKTRIAESIYGSPAIIRDLPRKPQIGVFVGSWSVGCWSLIFGLDFNDPCPMDVIWKGQNKQFYSTIHVSPNIPISIDEDVIRASPEQLTKFPTIFEWIKKKLFLPKHERCAMKDADPMWLFHCAIFTHQLGLQSLHPLHVKFAEVITHENISLGITAQKTTLSQNMFSKYKVLLKIFGQIDSSNVILKCKKLLGIPDDDTLIDAKELDYARYLRQQYSIEKK